MIEVTFSAETPEQLTDKLRATLRAWTAPDVKNVVQTAGDTWQQTNGHVDTKVAPLKPAGGKTKPTASAEKPLTAADVRRALTAFLTSKTQQEALELLRTYGGADNVSGVDPSKYKAVYEAAMAGVA